MQPLFSWPHRPKQYLYLHVGTQEEGILPSRILVYPSFEISQTCNSLSWDRGHMQISSCTAELFQKWAVCFTTWERSMSQMQTHASKNPGTPLLAAGIHKSAKESNVSPSSCADNNVHKISFLQWFCWGQVITSLGPACEIAVVRKMWGGYKLISWITGKTSFRKLSVERCFQHISGMMSR